MSARRPVGGAAGNGGLARLGKMRPASAPVEAVEVVLAAPWCRRGWPRPCFSPVPRRAGVTELRAFPPRRVVLSHRCERYYAALRLPPGCHGFRLWLIPGPASAAIEPAGGRGRAFPVDRPAVPACHLLYAGALLGLLQSPWPEAAAFAKSTQARRALPLTGSPFDAAAFTHRCALQGLLLLASTPASRRTPEVDYRAPLAACSGGTLTHLVDRPLAGHTWVRA